ncbi:MAG: NAD-dependent succinate-semialdehyde dehydrogenase [Spirochaetes bacterium]|nr:NAD-dependent succinate-semialdehyde dehydrogenase [Spirochaetota bacterium]
MIFNKMLINGECIENADGKYIEVENPATGEKFEKVPASPESYINAAVDAAYAAFKSWSLLSSEKRGEYLMKASNIVLERQDEIARIMTMEQGKPLNEARGEVRKGADILRYYAEEGKRIYGRIVQGYDETTTSYVIYQPIGVSAAISPWNYPIELVGWKVGAALAAGCTIVMKPPSETPLSPLNFIKCLVDAGVPQGVVNVIFGRGSFAGPLLIKNPLVKKVAFTGSTEVGKEVQKLCAQYMKKHSLELGGHCPLIVSRHCNLEEAVKGAVRRTFRNMGQICISINRIYVDKEILSAFMDAFADATGKLVIANGLTNPKADLGPMANKAGIEKTQRHIDDALNKGARIVYGGAKPEGKEFEKGHFFKPTILANVSNEMLVMNEESFGPIVGVMPYGSIDEAIEYANSTNYGLASYVYTDNLHEADEFAYRLESGNVAINNPDAGVINAPYGGFKESGTGYEHGPEGLEQYLAAKHVRIRYFNRKK